MKVLEKIFNSFFTSLGMLTRIPVVKRYSPDFSLFPFFLPVAGILFSIAVGGVYLAVTVIADNPSVTALAVLVSQYLMFNLFHFDGLLDSADALMYSTTPEKRLEILKDKSAGSFAVFTGGIYLAAKYTLLTELVSSADSISAVILLFSYVGAGRIAGGMVPSVSSPARDTGLGILLKDFSTVLFASGSAAAAALVFLFMHLAAGGASLELFYLYAAGTGAAVITGAASGLIYRKKAGGFTGDAVGMAVELGELAYLAVLAEMLPGGLA